MITLTRDDLRSLVTTSAHPCVSIYMPLHDSQPDSKQDAIRNKNLLDQAAAALKSRGVRPAEIDGLLQEARELQKNALFWRANGRKGLAMLIEPGTLRVLRSHERFDEFLAVANRYHVAPLVRAFSEPERFLLLAISANEVHVYSADSGGLTPVALPNSMPKSLEQATAGTEFDKGLQRHTSAARTMGNPRVGIVHGHGVPKDDQKSLLTEYLRDVVRHLTPIWQAASAPLVVAAVGYVHPIFRDVCSYPQLLSQGVVASPDTLERPELHRRALEVVRAAAPSHVQSALDRFRALQRSERVAFQIESIVPAADAGRVEVLFAANGQHVWGRAAGDSVEVHRERAAEDVDLVDLAIGRTIACNGEVYVVDREKVPAPGPMGAILRW